MHKTTNIILTIADLKIASRHFTYFNLELNTNVYKETCMSKYKTI